jgi:hypothetical protein
VAHTFKFGKEVIMYLELPLLIKMFILLKLLKGTYKEKEKAGRI